MTVQFYKAGCGDAARITFLDKNGVWRHIFIDSGYERTFREYLFEEIKNINSTGEFIDLWIISHIHDDHIGGACTYVNAIVKKKAVDIVKNWMFNAPRRPEAVFLGASSSEPKSIGQGDVLTSFLISSGKLQDRPATQDLDTFYVGDLKITLLSPSLEGIDALREKYSKKIPLEKSEKITASVASSAKMRDYFKKSVDFNLDLFQEDSNLENGSSIALLTEYPGLTILWLADSHPSIVANRLNKMGWSAKKKLRCDIVKVSHHGSAGNNSDALYDCIDCSTYIMSVDGKNIHGLPTKQCMLRILQNKNRDTGHKYTFYFTHDDLILKSIFAVDGSDIYRDLNFEILYLPAGQSSLMFG